MPMAISLVDEFGTPGDKSASLTSGNSEKKHSWTGKDIYNVYFTPHETKSNINICRVCSREFDAHESRDSLS